MRHETHKHTQEVKHESCVKESVVGQVDRDIKVKLRVVMLVRLESILTIQMKPYKEDSTDFLHLSYKVGPDPSCKWS